MFHGLTKRINIVTVVLTPIPNCSLARPNEAVFEENESKALEPVSLKSLGSLLAVGRC